MKDVKYVVFHKINTAQFLLKLPSTLLSLNSSVKETVLIDNMRYPSTDVTVRSFYQIYVKDLSQIIIP